MRNRNLRPTKSCEISAAELSKIKEYQRDFHEQFKKRLEIDFPAMKGVIVKKIYQIDSRLVIEEEPDLPKLLNQCVIKYNASITKIRKRSKRLQGPPFLKERAAVREFSRLVIYLKGNVKEAARLINRDRSLIYYYAEL